MKECYNFLQYQNCSQNNKIQGKLQAFNCKTKQKIQFPEYIAPENKFQRVELKMNQSTPTSLQNKINYLQNKMQQIYKKVTSKQNVQMQQLLRIKFISVLEQFIDKIQLLNQNDLQKQQNDYERKSNLKGYETRNQQNDKIVQLTKQKIQLEKKLIQYRQKQIKKQQYTLQLQRTQIEHIKLKNNLQKQISQLHKIVKQKQSEISYQAQKITHQQQQMQRLIRLNQKQMDQIDKVKQERNRAQKRQLELRQKYQNDQNNPDNRKIEKFNVKYTEGLRNVRILTNISSEKKNHEKYFVLELPAKIQVQKIVYGIRMGIVLQNKQIFYFNELFLYEKDPMKIELIGQRLSIQYLKRKQKTVLDKYKITKPQILILLYGKGDSVLIDQIKENK